MFYRGFWYIIHDSVRFSVTVCCVSHSAHYERISMCRVVQVQPVRLWWRFFQDLDPRILSLDLENMNACSIGLFCSPGGSAVLGELRLVASPGGLGGLKTRPDTPNVQNVYTSHCLYLTAVQTRNTFQSITSSLCSFFSAVVYKNICSRTFQFPKKFLGSYRWTPANRRRRPSSSPCPVLSMM